MKKISRGYKKYIRQEKSRIRRETLNLEEQEKLIKNLYDNLNLVPKE